MGAPILIKAYAGGMLPVLTFLALFYICLVGCKMALALAIGRWRHLLGSRGYIWTIRATGILLAGFSLLFLKDGRLVEKGPLDKTLTPENIKDVFDVEANVFFDDFSNAMKVVFKKSGGN